VTIASAVITVQTTLRKPMPEKSGSPAIPSATPTVNGFRSAPAKPAPAPTRAIAPPVTAS
jgi:hypothetical protein